MATGYTHPVKDGKVTFNQFVWGCARAFGALIMMRDDPMDAPIPEFQPSMYGPQQIAKTKAEIARLETMTPAELEQLVGEERRKATEENERYRTEHRETLARYRAMLAQVEAWEPPSSEHVGLKEFMASQLRDSIGHDCRGEPYQQPIPGPAGDWRDARLSNLREELPWLLKRHAEEVERANERNEWVATLKSSVPYERPTP